jgi:hypothetical protein
MAAIPKRNIKLLSLRDPHVVEVLDDGLEVNAGDVRPRQGRAQLERMLDKRVNVNGEAVPAFMLAEPTAKLHANDPVDDVLRRRATPSPEWMQLRADFIAKREERKESSRQMIDDRLARKAMKQLLPLLKAAQREDDDAPHLEAVTKKGGKGSAPHG